MFPRRFVLASTALSRRCFSAASTSSPLPALPRVDPEALLSEDDVDRMTVEGAIVVRQAVPMPWLEVLAEAAEANLANPGPLCDEHASAAGTGGRFHDDQFLFHRHKAFEEYVLRSGIGALAARAMRSTTAHILYDRTLPLVAAPLSETAARTHAGLGLSE